MELIILNKNYEKIGVIDSFKSAIWVDRFCKAGDFEIVFPINAPILSYIYEDYYLVNSESEHCMIVENIAFDSNIEEGNTVNIKGRSLESILDRRIVWTQTSIDGNLQTGLRGIFNTAFRTAGSARMISNFYFENSTDPEITKHAAEFQSTGDCIYDLFVDICTSFSIGFKVVLTEDNRFIFSLYAGEDRSYDQEENPYVVFSPNYENIVSSNYFTSNANYKNVTLVAGEGEGRARKTLSIGNAQGLHRRELFTDARDISSDVEGGTLSLSKYNQLLRARGLEKLAQNKRITAFEGEMETTKMFVHGKDFYLGDIVQVENEYGHSSAARISEIVFSQSADGIFTYPTFEMLNDEEYEV